MLRMNSFKKIYLYAFDFHVYGIWRDDSGTIPGWEKNKRKGKKIELESYIINWLTR